MSSVLPGYTEARLLQTLQVEKRHRLQLDEASQELLEGLQDQINDVEARQQQCCVVDCRIENAVKQVDEQATADRYVRADAKPSIERAF